MSSLSAHGLDRADVRFLMSAPGIDRADVRFFMNEFYHCGILGWVLQTEEKVFFFFSRIARLGYDGKWREDRCVLIAVRRTELGPAIGIEGVLRRQWVGVGYIDFINPLYDLEDE